MLTVLHQHSLIKTMKNRRNVTDITSLYYSVLKSTPRWTTDVFISAYQIKPSVTAKLWTTSNANWEKLTPILQGIQQGHKSSVFPLLHLHTIRRASFHHLRTNFIPVCGQHCPIWLNLHDNQTLTHSTNGISELMELVNGSASSKYT